MELVLNLISILYNLVNNNILKVKNIKKVLAYSPNVCLITTL